MGGLDGAAIYLNSPVEDQALYHSTGDFGEQLSEVSVQPLARQCVSDDQSIGLGHWERDGRAQG
jgi:ethanolamine ammonia-lyase small subunit